LSIVVLTVDTLISITTPAPLPYAVNAEGICGMNGMNNQTMIVNASGNATTKIGRNNNETRAWQEGKQHQELPGA